jgi:hypothetical protein
MTHTTTTKLPSNLLDVLTQLLMLYLHATSEGAAAMSTMVSVITLLPTRLFIAISRKSPRMAVSWKHAKTYVIVVLLLMDGQQPERVEVVIPHLFLRSSAMPTQHTVIHQTVTQTTVLPTQMACSQDKAIPNVTVYTMV